MVINYLAAIYQQQAQKTAGFINDINLYTGIKLRLASNTALGGHLPSVCRITNFYSPQCQFEEKD